MRINFKIIICKFVCNVCASETEQRKVYFEMNLLKSIDSFLLYNRKPRLN